MPRQIGLRPGENLVLATRGAVNHVNSLVFESKGSLELCFQPWLPPILPLLGGTPVAHAA